MLRRCSAVLAAVVAAAVISGCGGSGSTGATAGPTGPTPASTTAACPTPTAGMPPVWPAKVPKDLPKPPHAHILDQQTTSDGVFVLKFRTLTSLRDSVLFVVEKLPKAGYVLGRGDAEATEADAPFLHGNTRGLIRMLQTGLCTTDWLFASVDSQGGPTGNSPLLTPHTPTGSPSPLPFG